MTQRKKIAKLTTLILYKNYTKNTNISITQGRVTKKLLCIKPHRKPKNTPQSRNQSGTFIDGNVLKLEVKN